jgi:predicted ATPase/DNA-binding XRE family transcriptional regulator
MAVGAPRSFGAHLKGLREAAGFTQEELATIAGLSVHAVSALERGERRRPHVETVRALAAALELTGPARDALLGIARASSQTAALDVSSEDWLPVAPTVLVGRDADVQALRQLLDDTRTRLVTLLGPGGVGKTRLALEIARAIARERAARVVFVTLAALRNPAFVAPAIAEALGLSDVSASDLPRRARAACQDRPTLVVLDNLEHLLDAAPLVADLLTSVASLKMLVTSRAPLRVRGEREYHVGSLALADTDEMSPAGLSHSPAVRLFVERVRDVSPEFRLTGASARTVMAICRRLDALPLALELAAPWIKVLTLEQLLDRLEKDVLLSTPGPRDLPERQQTLNATIAWSYQLLDPGEQRAFRRFGALPGLFPIDAAAAVLAGRDGASDRAEEALAATAGLIDKSLLQRAEASVVPTCPLYQMLETVRGYAALALASEGERDDAMEGLVRYATAEAALAASGLRGLEQITWLDRVREDLETYRAALTWLIEQRRASEAAAIAWDLKYFWLIRGHPAEGLQWYEQVLNLPALPPFAELRALAGAAVLWYTHGDVPRARAATNRALSLPTTAGDSDVVLQATFLSGHLEHAVGNLDGARDRFARSVEGFRALGSAAGVGNGLSGMAVVSVARGDPDGAERLLGEATTVLRQAGPWFLTWALYVRAVLAVRRDRPEEAIALVRESLEHIRELDDRFAFVYALAPLAAAVTLKGDHTWAARILGARDAVTERTGVTVVDPSVRDLAKESEASARARLGPDRWIRAYAAGRVSSIDSVIQDIDTSSRPTSRSHSSNALE